jgi:hypothetical protein
MSGGEHNALASVAKVNAGNRTAFAALTKRGDLKSLPLCKAEKTGGMVEGMMGKIQFFSLAEGISEGITVSVFYPSPAVQICAHGGAPISHTLFVKAKDEFPRLRVLYTKGPVKPISGGIAKLVFKKEGVFDSILYPNVPSDKVLMYFHMPIPPMLYRSFDIHYTRFFIIVNTFVSFKKKWIHRLKISIK